MRHCSRVTCSLPRCSLGETVPEEEQLSAKAVEAMKALETAPSKETVPALPSLPTPTGVAATPTSEPHPPAPSDSGTEPPSNAKRQSRLSGEGLAGWDEERQRLYAELDEKVCRTS